VTPNVDLIEGDDHWRLPIAGMSIDQCCFDFAVVLRLGVGADMWEIRISQPFAVIGPDGSEQLVVPEHHAHLQAVLGLLRHEVEEAVGYKDGRLELNLVGGASVQVPPDEGYEAWEAAGPEGMRLIGLPGGDIAVWKSTDHRAE
jgi:Family of unknown function (DUF6188)